MKSITPFHEITAVAREGLSGRWGKSVGLLMFYVILVQGVFILPFALGLLPLLDVETSEPLLLEMAEPLVVESISLLPLVLQLLIVFYSGPLLLGVTIFFINLPKGRARVGNLFDGFDYFGKSLAAYLLMVLFLSCWSLLLVIPGIIKMLSYSMTFFIIADDFTVGASEAITRSRDIMAGNKMRLILLYLRFIGWGLLSVCTLGIGFLWLWPYIMASTTAFYEDIKDKV